jgi:hypothetical protein
MKLIKVLAVVCCSVLLGIAESHAIPFSAAPEEATSISDSSGVDQALCSVDPETGSPDSTAVTDELLNTGAFNGQYNPALAALGVGVKLIDKVNQGTSCDAADDELTECVFCSCLQRCCFKNGAVVACCLRNGRLVAC